MIEFLEEAFVDSFLGIIRYRILKTKTSIRYWAINIRCLVHCFNFNHFADSKEHAGRICFMTKVFPGTHKLGKGNRERTVFPSVGESIGRSIITAFPILGASIISCIHIAYKIFAKLEVVLVFWGYMTLQRG